MATLYDRMEHLETGWREALKEEFMKPYMEQLALFVQQERQSAVPIYPAKENVFNALQYTPFDKVRVVFVGQDPYHGPGQAHGLCFSVAKGTPLPPSLKNIYKELVNDVGIPYPPHGELYSWARQGVLMINATLTVRQGQPQSHKGKGWEYFTDAIIEKLCERKEKLIFVLWGRSAQEKCRRVKNIHHHNILTAAHPSPLSVRGFLGCRHFSKINEILLSQGDSLIDWAIKD